jgi:hypothetical protein
LIVSSQITALSFLLLPLLVGLITACLAHQAKVLAENKPIESYHRQKVEQSNGIYYLFISQAEAKILKAA